MDKIISFPGQVSIRIRQGSNRFRYMPLVEFGVAHPMHTLNPKGWYCSRLTAADLIRKLRKALKEISNVD